jgi:hypothetical protein
MLEINSNFVEGLMRMFEQLSATSILRLETASLEGLQRFRKVLTPLGRSGVIWVSRLYMEKLKALIVILKSPIVSLRHFLESRSWIIYFS